MISTLWNLTIINDLGYIASLKNSTPAALDNVENQCCVEILDLRGAERIKHLPSGANAKLAIGTDFSRKHG